MGILCIILITVIIIVVLIFGYDMLNFVLAIISVALGVISLYLVKKVNDRDIKNKSLDVMRNDYFKSKDVNTIFILMNYNYCTLVDYLNKCIHCNIEYSAEFLRIVIMEYQSNLSELYKLTSNLLGDFITLTDTYVMNMKINLIFNRVINKIAKTSFIDTKFIEVLNNELVKKYNSIENIKNLELMLDTIREEVSINLYNKAYLEDLYENILNYKKSIDYIDTGKINMQDLYRISNFYYDTIVNGINVKAKNIEIKRLDFIDCKHRLIPSIIKGLDANKVEVSLNIKNKLINLQLDEKNFGVDSSKIGRYGIIYKDELDKRYFKIDTNSLKDIQLIIKIGSGIIKLYKDTIELYNDKIKVRDKKKLAVVFFNFGINNSEILSLFKVDRPCKLEEKLSFNLDHLYRIIINREIFIYYDGQYLIVGEYIPVRDMKLFAENINNKLHPDKF